MNWKIFLSLGIIAVLLLVGCEEQQTGTDVSFVPIDDIKVEGGATINDSVMEKPPELPDVNMEENSSEADLEEDTTEEVTEEEVSVCEDGIDNDQDGLTDEEDPGCIKILEGIAAETAEEEMGENTSEAVIEEDTAKESMEETTTSNDIVIIVEETELVSLEPVAYDPDEDTIHFTYSTPLDDTGKWQTTYGDAGEYTVTITASDSELTTSKDALLIVNKKEEAPTIDSMNPADQEQKISENTELEFKVAASDLNKDPLTYEWKLDGDTVSTDDSFILEADYNSAGSHTVKVDVSDGQSVVSKLWAVEIMNVDRPPVLKVIPDITVKETETVSLVAEATDPDEDEITYTISDPVGDSGVWDTGYNDSGVYDVLVTASDGELEDSQNVKVTVINVNRPPVIENIIKAE